MVLDAKSKVEAPLGQKFLSVFFYLGGHFGRKYTSKKNFRQI
jgi:hypothetical protein